MVEPLKNLLESGELHEMDALLKGPNPISLIPDIISYIFWVSDGQKDPENTWIQWASRRDLEGFMQDDSVPVIFIEL